MTTQTRTAVCRMDSAWRKDVSTGYLDARVFPTKSGVFPYRNKDGSIRRELRPEEEVHKADSLKTLENKPHTNSHPPVLLNSKNTRRFSTGMVYGPHTVAEDGIHTQARVVVTDADTIAEIEQGKEQVSCGYTCKIKEESGVHPVHGPYDAIQYDIAYNHLASEWQGRAGSGAAIKRDADDEEPQLRFDAIEITDDVDIGPEVKKDQQQEKPQMDKIRIDGKEYTSAEAAQVALDHKVKADADAIQTAKAEADKQTARADKAEAERDELQAKLDAAQNVNIASLVRERASLETAAGKVLGHNKFDAMSDMDIKKEVVKKRNQWAKLDGKSDDYVNALYEASINSPAPRVDVMDVVDNAPEPVGSDEDPLAAVYKKDKEEYYA